MSFSDWLIDLEENLQNMTKEDFIEQEKIEEEKKIIEIRKKLKKELAAMTNDIEQVQMFLELTDQQEKMDTELALDSINNSEEDYLLQLKVMEEKEELHQRYLANNEKEYELFLKSIELQMKMGN